MLTRLVCCVAAALSLCGCGSFEIRPVGDRWLSFAAHARPPDRLAAQLANATLCCASLADLPYATINAAGVVAARIDGDAPAFNFAGGKSYFAAFDIRALPRPLSVRLASRRTAEAGTIARLLPDFRALVFAPQALVLDENFAVQRTIDPGRPLAGCATNAWSEVFARTIDISEPAAAAAYLVVLTSDALRKTDGEPICGVVRHGLSPIGDITLRIARIDFDDGALALKLPAKWYADARGVHEIGAFAGLLDEPGLLMLGETAVHFLEPEGFHYRERLRLPYARMVSARTGDFSTPLAHYLVVEMRGPGDASAPQTVYHSFESLRLPGETFVSAPEIVSRLTPKIRPGQRVEPIDFAVAEQPPALELLAGERGALERIGQAAVAGGVVTAFPCALCQTGACTPDILLSCAALFSVGALIGGVGSGASELAATLRGSPEQAPPPRGEALRQAINPLLAAASGEHFGRQALLGCIADELGGPEPAAWREQGRIGRPRTAGETTAGVACRAESVVSRIALRVDGSPGGPSPTPIEPPLRLLIEGELRFANFLTGQTSRFELSWESAPHAASAWVDSGAERVAGALRDGCRGLARQIVSHSRQAWQR